MFRSVSFFSSYTIVKFPFVTLLNGHKIPITHKGVVEITYSLILNNVLCVLSFSFNILFACQLIHSFNYCLIFLNTVYFIQNLYAWKNIGMGEEKSCLNYLLQNKPSTPAMLHSCKFSFVYSFIVSINLDLWHYHLGHHSFLNQCFIHKCFPTITSSKHTNCYVCHYAKQPRLSFSNNESHTFLPIGNITLWYMVSIFHSYFRWLLLFLNHMILQEILGYN